MFPKNDKILNKLNESQAKASEINSDSNKAKDIEVKSIFSDEDEKRFENIEDFEQFLLNREPESKTFGVFDTDVTVLRFFEDKKNELILSDIVSQNESENMGNTKIPGTNIRLYNYSYCPKCSRVYSFQDCINYYLNPKSSDFYKSKKEQVRKDTRMYCFDCDTYFLPSLIIYDGEPKNENQFLCRLQTIDAVEEFFIDNYNLDILSKNPENLIINGDKGAWLNDVDINFLKNAPALITNMIQYTPYILINNFITGKNLESKDILYGAWFKI